MKPELLETRNLLQECPKCGKRSLAQKGRDRYHCLWCGFDRDISRSEGANIFFIAAIFIVALITFLAYQTYSQTTELSPPESSSVPAFEELPNSHSPFVSQR